MTGIDRATLEELARARAAIECAIVTLQFYRWQMTEGQRRELKKILYGVAN